MQNEQFVFVRASKRDLNGSFNKDDRVKCFGYSTIGAHGKYISVRLLAKKNIAQGDWINLVLMGI